MDNPIMDKPLSILEAFEMISNDTETEVLLKLDEIDMNPIMLWQLYQFLYYQKTKDSVNPETLVNQNLHTLFQDILKELDGKMFFIFCPINQILGAFYINQDNSIFHIDNFSQKRIVENVVTINSETEELKEIPQMEITVWTFINHNQIH